MLKRSSVAGLVIAGSLVLSGCELGGGSQPAPGDSTPPTSTDYTWPASTDELMRLVERAQVNNSAYTKVGEFTISNSGAIATIYSESGDDARRITVNSGTGGGENEETSGPYDVAILPWESVPFSADFERLAPLLEDCAQPRISWSVAHNGERMVNATCGGHFDTNRQLVRAEWGDWGSDGSLLTASSEPGAAAAWELMRSRAENYRQVVFRQNSVRFEVADRSVTLANGDTCLWAFNRHEAGNFSTYCTHNADPEQQIPFSTAELTGDMSQIVPSMFKEGDESGGLVGGEVNLGYHEDAGAGIEQRLVYRATKSDLQDVVYGPDGTRVS